VSKTKASFIVKYIDFFNAVLVGFPFADEEMYFLEGSGISFSPHLNYVSGNKSDKSKGSLDELDDLSISHFPNHDINGIIRKS